MSEETSNAASNAAPPFKDGASSFGAFYPKHYVLAALADEAAAARAGDALRAAGFAADDVVVASGQDVARHASAAQASEGPITRLREEWSRLYTDDSATSQQLVGLAEGGAAFVLAYAPEKDEMNRAVNAVRPLQPTVLRYYGTFTVTDLS